MSLVLNNLSGISLNDVLSIIYRYYPKNIYWSEDGYAKTEEFLRRKKVCQRASVERAKWDLLFKKLESKFLGASVTDWSHLFNLDLCYRCRIHSLKNHINDVDYMVGISIIAPVYMIYSSGTNTQGTYIRYKPSNDVEVHYFEKITSVINAIYPYREMPSAWIEKVVPDISVGNQLIGETTVAHCLFTDHVF